MNGRIGVGEVALASNLMPVGMAVGGDGSTVVQGRVEHRRGQLHGGDRQHS